MLARNDGVGAGSSGAAGRVPAVLPSEFESHPSAQKITADNAPRKSESVERARGVVRTARVISVGHFVVFVMGAPLLR